MENSYPAAINTSPMPPPACANEPASASSTGDIIDIEYVKGFSGILKIIEMAFSLATFICASVHNTFIEGASGWIQFVSMTSFVCTFIVYTFYLFRITDKFPRSFPFTFSVFCLLSTFALFYFIAGVVAACFVYYYVSSNAYIYSPSMAAAAFFSFASMVLYAGDALMTFLQWRRSNEGPYFSSSGGATQY